MANAETVLLLNCRKKVTVYLYTESGVGQDGEPVKKGYSVSACSQFKCPFFVRDESKKPPQYPLPDGMASYTDGGEELNPECEVTNCANCI